MEASGVAVPARARMLRRAAFQVARHLRRDTYRVAVLLCPDTCYFAPIASMHECGSKGVAIIRTLQ